jgi:hypothetical protein
MVKPDSSSIENRLAKYGAMSLAVASGVLAVPAQASTIVTVASTACPGNNTTPLNGAVYFDPSHGTCGNSSAGALFKLENVTGASGTNILRAVGMTSHALLAGDGNFLTKLPTNATAGFSGGSFLGGVLEWSSGGPHHGNWQDGDTGYIGLLMNASGYHYGWAQIQITGYQATLVQFAYNDNIGAPPTTSPEPSSMALLAFGAAGIGAYRRKKAKAA